MTMDTNVLCCNEDKKCIRDSKFLIWIGFLLYVGVTGGKNIYTAEIITLMEVFEATKAQITLASTYYFVTYAISQFALTFLLTKFNLRYFISISAVLTSLSIILIGCSSSLNLIYAISFFNGFFSAGIYVGVMAVLSKNVPQCLIPYTNQTMSVGAAVYNVLAYGLPALFVDYGLWRVPFILLGGLSIIFAVLFFVALSRMKKYTFEKVAVTEKSDEPIFIIKGRKQSILYYTIFMIVALLFGIINYTVMTYFPNLLKEVFGMPNSYSILITVLLPIMSAISAVVSISICKRYKNYFFVGVAFGVLSLVFLICLSFTYHVNMALTIVVMVLVISLKTAMAKTYSTVLAFNMRNQVNTGSYLAAINAITSLCAGVVPPIIGNLIDAFPGSKGFGVSYLVASVVLVIALILFLAIAFYCHKKQKSKAMNDK